MFNCFLDNFPLVEIIILCVCGVIMLGGLTFLLIATKIDKKKTLDKYKNENQNKTDKK